MRAIAKEVKAGKLKPCGHHRGQHFRPAVYRAHARPRSVLSVLSGEIRTSNFLLWQSAYSEYYFTDVLWPDFSIADMDTAIADFGRSRRLAR